jgi:hypothetical protein
VGSNPTRRIAMRPTEEIRRVRSLAVAGRNASQIARATGIPRSTVRDWLRPAAKTERPRANLCTKCGHPPHAFDRLPESEYAYLLGMYLGDGVISRHRRDVYRLRIVNDMRYTAITAECAQAMRAVMPTSRVLIQTWVGGARQAEISSYSKAWPCLFPQHGPGLKHTRRIELAWWQETIVDRHPEAFIRGLIHSDGCRVLNRVNGKDYPRYFFTQVSTDIRELFCRSCRQLGIRYTFNKWKEVSVAQANSVAILDAIVGPKS